MDNSAKSQDDHQMVQPQADDVLIQTDEGKSHPAGAVAPISGSHKEAAPISAQTSEYLAPAEAKPALAKEVREVGVEHAPEERPVIPHDVSQAGVTHAKESLAHPVEPSGVISLPQMTQAQALVMKKRSVKDAARWLATLVLRQIDKIAYQKLPIKQ